MQESLSKLDPDKLKKPICLTTTGQIKMYTSESVDQRMADYITKSDEKVRDAIDFLVAKRRSIGVKIQGEQTLFDSMIVKVDHGTASKSRAANRVYIQWLSPPTGNFLIQSSSAVQVKFSLGKYNFAFTSDYITMSLESPYLGHIISYPKALAAADRRWHDRYEVGSKKAPIFATASIRMKEGRSQVNIHDLNVFDVSENGVGILVGKKLFNWLARLEIGARLNGVELSAPWAIVKAEGVVRHKSKLHTGKYSGYHLLGIELDEKLEHYVSDRSVAGTARRQNGSRMST